jgi:type III restriction enzyme
VDEPVSPVRAIVSVDKLKDGWDVSIFGVIVARRALASQTLTEQILGRGLRLPFGRRTDVGSIDQVDIVAHEAYAELLRNKDALLQKFRDSTSSAVAAPAPTVTGDGQLDLAPLHGTTIDDAANGFVIMEAEDGASLDGLGAAEILLAQEMGAQEQQLAKDKLTCMEAMPLNDFPPFHFPLSVPMSTPAQFSLAKVDAIRMEQQGTLFKNDATVKLVRRAIDAQIDIHGQVQVIDRLVQSEDASRVSVQGTAIRAALLSRIVNSGLIEPNLEEQLKAVDLIDRFLAGAGIDQDDTWEWSADHAARAEAALFGVIRAAAAGMRSTTTYRWESVLLPAPRPRPSTPLSVWDEFRTHAWIGPWEKSIDKFASFDSESAEFRLAQKLETFENVVSWQRIYQHGPAWVAYKAGRYFPDFVVLDSNDVQWVLEAKANKAAVDSVEVQEKAEAAQAWVDRVNASKLFGSWRYRVVTEMQIAAAINWDALTGA